MTLKPYQEEIFQHLKQSYGSRIKNDDNIRKLIEDCGNLIQDISKNNEVDITQKFSDYLKNVSITMDILEKFRPSNLDKISKEFIILALLQYVFYCENLVTLFEKFIIKNANYNFIYLSDIRNKLRISKRKMLRYGELKAIASSKEKNEQNILVSDFVTAMSTYYPQYYKLIFKHIVISHFRNAIAHNKFILDEKNQKVRGIYNPSTKKYESYSFLDFIDLHDLLMAVYLCLVTELTKVSSK